VVEQGEALSERELEILQLVATGATNRQVAHELGISANTVKVHLRNVFTKLGVESRTEATMVAVRENWIAVPGTAEVPASPATEGESLPRLSALRRVMLLAAAFLALAGVALSWWSPVTASDSAQGGLLPSQEGVTREGIVDLGEDSQWMEAAQMPSRRAWLGLVAWDGRLFAIGGEGPEGVTGEVEVYDPDSDTWARGAQKPTAVAYITAVGDRGQVFVPGGCGDDGLAVDQVEVYDPAADTWRTVAPLPQPVCAYALAVSDGQLYLFGGTDGEKYLASTYAYDPAEDRWHERAPMPQARALAAAASLEGRIYVVGGYRAGKELASCAAYDPAANVWGDCTALTMPRSGLGLVSLGGQLYAVGGGGFLGYLGFNERYDPAVGEWRAVETPLTGAWQGAGVALLDLTIYTAGGRAEDYLSLTLAFDPFPFRIFIPATER